jgi:hypothetical protein
LEEKIIRTTVQYDSKIIIKKGKRKINKNQFKAEKKINKNSKN